MRNDTRIAFNAFAAQIARLNGVPNAFEQFDVNPSVQQTLETKMQESADFLKRVNIVPVPELKGELIGLGIGQPIASRTNTAPVNGVPGRRQPVDPTSLDNREYELFKTNWDTYIRYAKIDLWAKFPDFQTRMRDAIVIRMALDRLMVGFNGESVAVNTNRVANPLGQDVNIGWLEKLRTEKPAAVINDGKAVGAGPIKIGPNAADDYRSLDALVYDATEALASWYQEDTGIVAIVGRKLMHDKYAPLFNGEQADLPTEQLAGQTVIAQKRMGGRQAMVVPYMPPNSILLTRPDNLSIYVQEGARRRNLKDEPEHDRIANYESSNDGYAIEDPDCAVLIENVQISAG